VVVVVKPEELGAIEARAAAATEGPWEAKHDVVVAGDGFIAAETYHDTFEADAIFIAAARDDVPALLSEVRRLQAHIEYLEST
jgi:hypothetical protein